MAIVSLETLKGYFNNGDVPSESDYIDLIDTLGSLAFTDISADNISVAEDLDVDGDILLGEDLNVIRDSTPYVGRIHIAAGHINAPSNLTLTTSWQDLISVNIPVPVGGGHLHVSARIHFVTSTYGSTHLEATMLRDGGTADYIRERPLTAGDEFVTPMIWYGSASAGTVSLKIRARKNVAAGSYYASTNSKIVYALFV